jgi:predicted transcriptional regulator
MFGARMRGIIMSEPSATITISHAIKARLEALGARTEQSPSALAEEAIEQFLEDEARIVSDIQQALVEMKNGEGIPHKEAMEQIEKAISFQAEAGAACF